MSQPVKPLPCQERYQNISAGSAAQTWGRLRPLPAAWGPAGVPLAGLTPARVRSRPGGVHHG